MKKLFTLALITMLCIACSTEEETTISGDTNLEVVLENYKGVFTTTDGQHRGTLDITLSQDERSASGELTLATGEIVSIFTDQVSDLGNRKEITFNSNELSFTLITGEEGETLEIDTATFRGVESSILASKNTERAPVTPITGTYACASCPPPLDDSQTQTFNLMFTTSNGNSTMSTQTTLGMAVYNGVGMQDSCAAGSSQTTCDINSGDGMTNVGYIAGGGPVTWTGTHTFDNGASGPSDCSGASGTWSWTSPTLGTLGGTFTSDAMCPLPLTQLAFEDFEDNTLTFTVPVVANVSGGLFHDGGNDYAHIVPLNGSAEPDITSMGMNHFGVEDMDDGNTRPRRVDLVWENLNVAAFSNVTVSTYFAESNQNGAESWDSNSAVFVEYSFNNTSWTPILTIQSATGDNSAPRIDTNGDGNGDGTEIVNTFQEFTPQFATGGNSTVSVRIRIENLDLTHEDIAIDNVTISAN